MPWTNLPTNFRNLIWSGLKKFRRYDNPDNTVSFEDVTEYSETTNTQMSAEQLNQMTGAVNDLMNGVVVYLKADADTRTYEICETVNEKPLLAEYYITGHTYEIGDVLIVNNLLQRVSEELLPSRFEILEVHELTNNGNAKAGDYYSYEDHLFVFNTDVSWSGSSSVDYYYNQLLNGNMISLITYVLYDPEESYTNEYIYYNGRFYQYNYDGGDNPQYAFEPVVVAYLISELQTQIDNINNFAIHICTTGEYDTTTYVPTIQNPQPNTFYLVPTNGSQSDLFSEWIYVNSHWEKFGVAVIDLSVYYTKTETDTLLAAKANAADLGALAGKDQAAWDSDISGIPQTFPPSSHNHDDRYYTEQETDTLLAAKADSTAVIAALALKADGAATAAAFDEVDDEIDSINGSLSDLSDQIDEIINQSKYKKYGVTGIGLAGASLTRTMDAIGMVAQVGTDGDNSSVVNDFDTALPFMRRKCVGDWELVDGKAHFVIQAYEGDADYAEDGTMGDYVAVECPRCYYHRDALGITITSYPYPYFRPFDIFCRDHNPADTMEKIYLPAYALGMKDGQAVSLPGYENEQGCYKELLDRARTYKNGALGNLAIIQPYAVNFYEWALFTVEFATQNCQNVMYGMANMRSDGNTRCKFIDQTHILVTDWAQAAQTSIASWSAAWRQPGDYLCVLATSVGDIHASAYKATHRVVSVTRCDATGTASSSGQYSLIEVQNLGKNYWTYDYTGATDYKLAGRPYPTGACSGVSTPSGSLRSNSDGHNPMKYRGRENVYGNQYKTLVDLFDTRIGTGDSDWTLEWYYLPDPAQYSPSANDRPNISDLAASPFIKLDLMTAHENYVSGYVRSKKYSAELPDVWIPWHTSGGSGTTYYCDQSYLVNSIAVRACRVGGNWPYGAYAGFSHLYASLAPSAGSAIFGADLFFIQK